MALSYLPTDSAGEPCRFLNHYRCDACDEDWTDRWSCACDDDCPSCGASISPHDYDEEGDDEEDEAGDDERDHVACHACGRVEHIDLLDAKPGDLDAPENCDWQRLECIACYGPLFGGWNPAGTSRPDLVSICPDLHGLYRGWRILNWIIERRVAFRYWRARRRWAREKAARKSA